MCILYLIFKAAQWLPGERASPEDTDFTMLNKIISNIKQHQRNSKIFDFGANSADKSGSSKFWIKSRNVKEQEFWGDAVFSGVSETGDPRIYHVKSVSAWEVRSWRPTRTGEPLCPRFLIMQSKNL